MMIPKTFTINEAIKTTDGLGGSISVPKEICKVNGWIDLMSGTDDRRNQNAFTEDSTHVLITDGYSVGLSVITDKMVVSDTVKTYQITYVDNPLGINHHLEIYLKVK